jgi:hypothetical protein
MEGNYSRVEIAEGINSRVRLRCTGSCSALHLAVVLDLELDEFERWNAPEPVPSELPKSVAGRPHPRTRVKKTVVRATSPYEQLRALVQAVLDAKGEAARESALREAHREGLRLPVDPMQVEAAITAAAREVGIPEARARELLRGE